MEERELTRQEKIDFCKESAEYFGIPESNWEMISDKQLDIEVEWYDYLWGK